MVEWNIVQGALAILNGLYPNDIHQLVYSNLGEILDLLSLINCNTCFVIYAIMSSAYRSTLKQILQNSFQKFPTVNATASIIIQNRSDSMKHSQYLIVNDTYL
uniref:Uncharacterized protein n=1 Tax=Acrobeloides nanus TaxID=290746 RepID=A0A914DEE2_9BILA